MTRPDRPLTGRDQEWKDEAIGYWDDCDAGMAVGTAMRSNVELDEFVLTPDHFLGIITLHAERNGESFVPGEWLFFTPIRPNSQK